MRLWSELTFRARALFGGAGLEAELDEELRFHVEKTVEKLVAEGWSREEAEREAARRFGSYRRQRDRARWAWGVAWFRGVGTDLRQVGRQLRRAPGFTVVVTLTLALGLGGSAAMFTLVDRVVLDPLPYPEADRLVALTNAVPGVGEGAEWHASTAQYVHFAEHAASLQAVGLYRGFGVNIITPEGPERARMTRATASLFPLLGARPLLGRMPSRADDAPGGPSVVVLSHAFWEGRMGGDRDVIGRTLPIDGQPYEVVGVLEPEFDVPGQPAGADTELWTPMRIDPRGTFGNNHVFRLVGRIAAGSGPEGVESELARLTTQLPDRFPNAYSEEFFERYGFRTVATPLKTYVVGEVSRTLWILFGAVGLVLLVAAANVANLFLVRLEERGRELAVRSALGAGRRAIARHVLTESLALSLAGGVLALAVGRWGLPLLLRLAPGSLPRVETVSLGGASIAFTLALALAVGLGVAAYPLARLSGRRGSPEVQSMVGGRSMSAGRDRQRLRAGLVVTQVALALTLVAGAGLLLESLRRLADIDPGIDARGVVTAGLFLTFGRYEDSAAMWLAYREILDRVRAIPGVEAAGMTTELPVLGDFGCTVQGFADPAVYERLRGAGMTTCAGQEPTTPGYFEAMGIPLLDGRSFTDADNDAPTRAAAVVSRAFADRFWPGEDPLGKGVAPSGRTEGPFYRVVGVVGDVPAGSLDGDPALAIYYPIVHDPRTPGNWGGWWPVNVSLVVRTGLPDPIAIVPAVRTAVREVDPTIPLAHVVEMEEIVADSTARYRFASALLSVAGLAGLLLAAVGLYGVVSYVVGRRTREIGIRIAVGAEPADVRRAVVGRSLGLVGLGLAAGLVLAVATTRLMQGILYGVEPTHPVALGLAAATLALAAALASWLPARRAARVDPIEALRVE